MTNITMLDSFFVLFARGRERERERERERNNEKGKGRETCSFMEKRVFYKVVVLFWIDG